MSVPTVVFPVKAAMTGAFPPHEDGTLAILLGYWSHGDGGGGSFYWDALSTTPADGGTIFQRDAGDTGR